MPQIDYSQMEIQIADSLSDQQIINQWIREFPTFLSDELHYVLASLAQAPYTSEHEGMTSRFFRFLARIAEQGPPNIETRIPVRELYRLETFEDYARNIGVSVTLLRPIIEARFLKAIEAVDWETLLEAPINFPVNITVTMPGLPHPARYSVYISERWARRYLVPRSSRHSYTEEPSPSGFRFEPHMIAEALTRRTSAIRDLANSVSTTNEAVTSIKEVTSQGHTQNLRNYHIQRPRRRSFMINLEQEGFKIKCKLGDRNETDDSQRELQFTLTRGWGRNAQSNCFTSTTGFPITKTNLLKLSEELKKLSDNF